MFWQRDSVGLVDWAFTDREGGVSAPPYDSLNLSVTSADDPEAVAENHRRVVERFAPGCPVADMDQVHGHAVAVAEPDGARVQCDGLVSDRPDVVLAVRVADCVPVVLSDAEAGVVGVAHAGRPGIAAGVLPAVVAAMVDLGAVADRTTAWIGPHVCGSCYEVPAPMQDDIVALEPATRATTSWGTPSLDLGAGARAQLERVGVQVAHRGGCTRETPRLYSYRRDGAGAGRLAGLVRRRTS